MGYIIDELPGEWNCQIRLGGLFLKDLKILHFWSKRNMPLLYLASSEFLQKIKMEGLNDIETKNKIINFYDTFYRPLGLVANEDLQFNFSPLYEEIRNIYVSKDKDMFSGALRLLERIYEKRPKNKMARIFININKGIYRTEIGILKFFSNSSE